MLDAWRAARMSRSSPSTPLPSPMTSGGRSEAGLSLTLTRKWKTEKSTIGELCVDGAFECFLLEDRDRLAEGLPKIPGQTAIPAGTYSISLTYSPKFGRILPQIEDVPGFEGVRIHPGNKPEDSDGCPLTGRIRGPDQVAESILAFDALFAKLQEAEDQGRTISISVRQA